MSIAAVETTTNETPLLASNFLDLHSRRPQGRPEGHQCSSTHPWPTFMATHKRVESTNITTLKPVTASSNGITPPSYPFQESMSQQQQSNPWNIPGKEWRDMDARSAPFQTGNPKEPSSRSNFINNPSSASTSSPPKTSEGYTPALAAPRAVPPYPRFTSPQPADTMNRSPSPSKKGSSTATANASNNAATTTTTTTSSSSSATSPFSFPGGSNASSGGQGDARERWASLGQAQQNFISSQQQQQQQHHQATSQHSAMSPTHQSIDLSARKMIPPGPFPNEAFLGYNDIWSNGGGQRGPASTHQQQQQQAPSQQTQQHHHQQPSLSSELHHISGRSYTMPSSQQPPDLELLNTRFDPSNVHYGREEGPYSAVTSGPSNGNSLRGGVGGGTDMPPFPSTIPSSGSLSPRSILHYHQQQLQAQQAIAMQAAQHGGAINSTQSNQITTVGSTNANEEITTVFIVGFPDDMSEREFANMFLFAKGFEASTLKIPSGSLSAGPGQRLNNEATGAGGPYSAVNMPTSGMFDQNGPPGGWDEHSLSLALSRAGTGDAFPPLGSGPAMAGGSSGANAAAGPGGKIKQIIGFAKFRTRSEALEARDALNGRKIDAERGCVLKTEMAKKNLHTKQRPVLSVASAIEGGGVPGPSSAVGPPIASQYGAPQQQQQHPLGSATLDREPTFIPRQQSRPDGQNMSLGPLPYQAFPPLNQAGQQYTSQNNGAMMSPTSEGVYGRGADFFPRNRPPPQEGPQSQMEAARGPNGDGNSNKWAPLGPLDYYENSQQRGGQGGNSSGPIPPRGPDWSALGSPPGLYASAAARATEPSSNYTAAKSSSGVTSSSSGGPLSPFGDQSAPLLSSSSGHAHKQSQSQSQSQAPPPPSFVPQQEQREDFGRGESTASERVAAINMNSSSNSNNNTNNNGNDYAAAATAPTPAPMQSPTTQGAEKSNEADRRPQSRVSQRSRQGSRTTSPVNVSASTFVQRFGSLRIDSPNIHQYPRAFSPNPKSPSGEQFPPYKSASSTTTTTNATSPTSPFLDHAHNLPSPTSRSFSIDANPPGNTLFVGNLPGSIVTPPATTQLEEALRKLFSAKNGFRQMSFRVKSSGPMCFVEFEDVGCAGRALGEANGETLDGVVKGGLRLSFSKNPLFKSTLPDGNGVSRGDHVRSPTLESFAHTF